VSLGEERLYSESRWFCEDEILRKCGSELISVERNFKMVDNDKDTVKDQNQPERATANRSWTLVL
jgi:hypothetical protein